MNEKNTQKGFVLGEPVRDKVTGQKMYVEKAWNPEVTCVYWNPETNKLVKVEVSPEDLEKVEELLFKRV
ncbi:hypothetical protein MAL01_10175 [Leptospira noguchii]|uniref:hypothetical protein n=1 Tax=Leptospira noguchii TaxID=28182 RepID=UPI001FB5F6EF|nr:hypothetical protein [Leptospira noguchii]UOG33023.1 hypothetical protein MAL02_09920 [Leptospira noguchii]UOG33033.1 hypothetical protein MAL02_09985 [Leptospira noguchii]UOG43833.1 hypothetical protein MAL01_10110 [Leptospira noguchii]UOG43843.1 hypothetical protein MAL01_10175 [Leptospira noguchii]